MRLTQGEIDTIVRIAREIYGWGVEVFLFGSRTVTVSGVGILICWLEARGRKKGSWNGCEW